MRANYKKPCELCGRKHIIASNKDGRVCTYCKVNRRKEAIEYLKTEK